MLAYVPGASLRCSETKYVYAVLHNLSLYRAGMYEFDNQMQKKKSQKRIYLAV